MIEYERHCLAKLIKRGNFADESSPKMLKTQNTSRLAKLAVRSPREGTLSLRHGVGSCRGSFGELLQGQLPSDGETNGTDFLVTLPVNAIARATFLLQPLSNEVRVFPSWKTKTQRFANDMVRELGLSGGILFVRSEIAEGKGCASSSSDMAAAARAIAQAFDFEVPNALVERIMLAIEPTDGVMYDECTLYRFRSTGLDKMLGKLPPLLIAALDEQGQVDTLSFDSNRGDYSDEDRAEYLRLLDDVSSAIEDGDLAAIGRVSTRSAELHQSRLPKRHLRRLLNISRDVNAVGIVVAHSGTFAGLILDPAAPSFSADLSEVLDELARLDGDVMVFDNFREHT